MTNKSKELVELLGIPAKIKVQGQYQDFWFEPTEYGMGKAESQCEWQGGFSTPEMINVNFKNPENNQILRDCIIKAGGSIVYDDSEVNVYFKYVDCTGIVTGDDTYNAGLVYALEGIINQLHIPESEDFKIYEKLKIEVKKIEWVY